jgi:LysM repeat protein
MKTGSIALQRFLGVLFILALLSALVPMVTSAEPSQQGPIVYYVRYGDTLFSIARWYGTTVPALMQANGLMSEYIYAGQRLVIPLPPITPFITPTPFPTPSNFDCTYTVIYRDTIFSIGYRYGVPYQILMQANYMYTPYLRTGQTLRVPCLSPEPTPFPTHLVQSGENLFRIAIQYQTSIYAIARTNGIWNPHWIYAGQNLVIPYPNSTVWPTVPTVTPRPPTGTPNPLTPTQTPVTPGPTPTGGTSVAIIMFNIQYVPNALTIQRGQTVMWQNNDVVNHSVRSGIPGTPTNLFNSGTIAPGNKFYFTFNDPGTFPFFSELDQNMTGTITVR